MRLTALVLGLLFAGLAHAQQPQLPLHRLTAGMHVIQAEVADTHSTRMLGLMHRQALASNHGMLFVFDETAVHCMWMKNTLIPLSVAFIDESGAIVSVSDMQPHSEQSHCAAKPARYALEMTRGWFASKGIKPGARLRGLDPWDKK